MSHRLLAAFFLFCFVLAGSISAPFSIDDQAGVTVNQALADDHKKKKKEKDDDDDDDDKDDDKDDDDDDEKKEKD